MQDQEVSKYIKKKPSNVSKAKEKTKHKHEYICEVSRFPSIIPASVRKEKDDIGIISFCKHCGKVWNNTIIKYNLVHTYSLNNNDECINKLKEQGYTRIYDINKIDIKYLDVDNYTNL